MLVIFDCDGVLVDSEPLANTCFARALTREGLDWSVEETMRRLIAFGADGVFIERRLGRPGAEERAHFREATDDDRR